MWSWAAWLTEGLTVLQAKQPPVAEPSGTLKQEPSGRSSEPTPELDFTPMGYITSFPEGNWIGKRN